MHPEDWVPPRVTDPVASARLDPLAVRRLRIGMLLLVEARGELTGATVTRLTPAVGGGQPASDVLIDLSGVTFVDPVAADQLLAAHDRLGREGRRLVLLCPLGDARGALEAAGLTDIVPAFAELDGEPFSPPPAR